MIPLRLTVKNFMCYRDNVPTLDLESIHVACLCGDNGHGKSALLDAITWVLWGQARTRTQEELVHQGQMDMAVELDFLARGQEYRVSRRHSRSARSRQGTTILELQVASDDGDGYRPITGNSVRDTEARIRDLLHMDYDTFTNTAFLLQGQADLFTRSTPSKRKECLAEVLDLSYYQGLEERAKARSRAMQTEMRDADGMIALRQQEIARRPEYEEQLASINADLARITPETEAQRLRVEGLRRDVDSLNAKRAELETIALRLADVQGDIAHMGRQVRGHEAKVGEYEAVVRRDSEIREQYDALLSSRTALEKLDQALASNSELERAKAGLEKEIAVQSERLSSEESQLRARINQELEPKARRIPEIEENLGAATREKARLDELEETVCQRRGEAEKSTAELERLNHALGLMNGLSQKKAGLESEVAIQKERLSGQSAQLRTRIAQDLEPRASRLPKIEEEMRATAQEEQALSGSMETIRRRQDETQEMDGRIQYLMQTNESLRKDMDETHKKYELLEQGDALCPVCNQPLGEDGTEHLRREYQSQGMEAKRQFQANKAENEELSVKRADLKTLVSQLDAELEGERKRIQAKATTLKREHEESQVAHAELQPAIAEFEQREAQLNSEDFAHKERELLSQLDVELAALDYDPDKRSVTQKQASELNAQVSRLDSELNQGRQTNQNAMTRLERDLEDSRKAEKELQSASVELERVTDLVRTEDFAHEERRNLTHLNDQISAMGYDAETHASTREQVKSLDGYGELHRKLLEAVEALPVERESLDTTREMLARRQQETRDAEERRVVLEIELTALTSVEAQLGESEARHRELDGQMKKAEVDKGILDGKLAHCDALEAEVRQQEEGRRKLIDEKSVYDELAAAFGKNGIQALIIESAIPQLEADANELLGRLTENRMFLKLQLQEGRKDSRTGLPSEELDIKIADEIGTRSYETFSGGEAFRINFALRIALSKLLARRSGAPLPILFIDEGFGSQDSAGQERLTEAIQSIQDDFKKIIVITHIEQVKDAFPVRIEVTKDSNGSTFRVV
ncbi:MAG: SMC family ATPase [Chloroflexi bacterium]|nr:SMC family ATPase [Chloroflexota bacterium]